MAVLKDLIVHGPSRFVNVAQFNALKTNKLGAEEGIFNKLVATTGKIDSLDVSELTAGKATVLSLLDVRGELHTNQWTNSNIATIDGSFYITPTIGVSSGTITIPSLTTMTINGSNFPVSSLYISTDATASTTSWTSGSKVLVTGEILIDGVYMPLGTLVGVLDGNATATQIKIKSLTDNRYQSAASLAEIGVQSTAKTCRNVKVSLYQRANGSTLYPLGIYMTALGENGKTFIDMYGGGYAASAVAGGFAKPALRIGNLAGLPEVGGQTPTGWGIYTSNGYFSGTIAADKGKIANFTINGTKLYSNDHSAYNTSVTGIYIGDDYISFGSGGVTYFNTSGTGKIGPWTLSTSYIRNGAIANATNTSVKGVYLGTDGLNISNGTAATTAYITKTAVNIGNKLTWNGSTLSVSGTINATAGKIGGFDIVDGVLQVSSIIKDSTHKAVISSEGMKIYSGDATNEVASFGATATIGKTTKEHITLTDAGLNVFKNYVFTTGVGEEEQQISVAFFGETARIGREDKTHVNINSNSISMADGSTTTVYEVKSSKGAVVITKVFEKALEGGTGIFDGTFSLPRTIKAITKVIMTYSIKQGKSGKVTEKSRTYTSIPIHETTADCEFTLEKESGSDAFYFEILGGSSSDNAYITFKAIRFEFSTDQPAVENIFGTFPDTTFNGPLKIGNGITEGTRANAMLVDWDGNARFRGDVVVNCDTNSGGGLSLSKPTYVEDAYYFESSTACVSIDVAQVGAVVSLWIMVQNSTTHAGGTNISSSNLRYAHIPMPITAAGHATGAAFYGNHSVIFGIVTNEDTGDPTLVSRNASTTNISIPVGNYVGGTLTYIWDGVSYTDDEY